MKTATIGMIFTTRCPYCSIEHRHKTSVHTKVVHCSSCDLHYRAERYTGPGHKDIAKAIEEFKSRPPSEVPFEEEPGYIQRAILKSQELHPGVNDHLAAVEPMQNNGAEQQPKLTRATSRNRRSKTKGRGKAS